MGSGRILVIDDEAQQRMLLRALLSKLGYEVELAASGEEGVAWLKEKDADLVILDMSMGEGMDGLDTYREIRSFKAEQPVLIASGFAQEGRAEEALQLGVRGFVSKPFKLKLIGRAVKDALKADRKPA